MKFKNLSIILPSLGIILFAIGFWVVLSCKKVTFTEDPPPTGPEIGFIRLKLTKPVVSQSNMPTQWRTPNACSGLNFGSQAGDIVSFSDKNLGGATMTNDKKFLRVKTFCDGTPLTFFYEDNQIKEDKYIDVPVSLTKTTTISIFYLDRCCSEAPNMRLSWVNSTSDSKLEVQSGEANLLTATTNLRERTIFLILGIEQCL